MTIAQDVLSQEAPSLVELFKIDMSAIPAISTLVYYLTPSSSTAITWGGNSYQPWAINIDGVGFATEGSPVRPTLSIGNLDVSKLIGTAAFAYGDIVGAKVTYVRTFSTYLNTSLSLPPLKYVIRKKTAHTQQVIVFELGSPLDKELAYLPARQVLKRDFPGISTNKSAFR